VGPVIVFLTYLEDPNSILVTQNHSSTNYSVHENSRVPRVLPACGLVLGRIDYIYFSHAGDLSVPQNNRSLRTCPQERFGPPQIR